jgi:glycopeptide antibiotics resistance protein
MDYLIGWGRGALLLFGAASAIALAASVAATFAMSVGVELWQAATATGRSSDVTDIVVNTAGGLVGFALGRAVARPPARQEAA